MVQNEKKEKMDEREVGRLREAVLNWLEKRNAIIKKNDEKTGFFGRRRKNTDIGTDTGGKIGSKKDVKQPNAENKLPMGGLKTIILRQLKTKEKDKTSRPADIQVKLKNQKLLFYFKIILVSIAIVIFGLIIFGSIAYYASSQNRLVRIVTRLVPYPIAIVNYRPIFYSDWINKVDALQNFYQKIISEDPTSTVPDLKQTEMHILNRMIEREILNQIATEYQVEVTSADIVSQTRNIANEIGSQEILEDQLAVLYDWSINEFQNEIIEPLILKNKLTNEINRTETEQIGNIDEYILKLKDEAKILILTNLDI